jgi:acyl carrier protein
MDDAKYLSIKQRLTEVFHDVFDDTTIALFDEMTAKDIEEWDSLMHITLVVNVEKEFGITLNAAEVGKLENVGAMIKILMERATK